MNEESRKREELYKKTLADYLEQYMREDTPEEERIIDYDFRGYGNMEEGDRLKAGINFGVKPYLQENTKWKYNTGNLCTNKEAFNFYCFVTYKKVNGEYEVERISEFPENYDEFLARFEEYKANLPEETVRNETVQADSTENYLASQEIKIMSNGIWIGCGILLILAIGVIVSSMRKRK